jgi:two-component system sensor kinase FixL
VVARVGRRPAVPVATKDPVRAALSWISTRAQAVDWQPVLASLFVALGYYAGVKVGFALTFHPHPISALWPPNAVLLGALLVTPVRWWWMLIAAVLPAHLNAQLDANVPTAMVLGWFVSNVSEALIGAVFVRHFVAGQLKLDSLRSVIVFILFAAILAPFLSSFLDAAFVTFIGWGRSAYWDLWWTRFCSNILSALTIAPVIVSWTAGAAELRGTDAPRIPEAGVLLLGLLAVCVMVFTWPSDPVPPALLYLPLPFLVWAALRFGPAGASTSFAIMALTAIWGASHGKGPFSASSPLQNAVAVQMFLIFLAITLLALAAIVRERRDTEKRLRMSEQRFATAFRSSPDAMIVSRRSDGHIIEVNDRWVELIGYAREEAIGRTAEELGLFQNGWNRARLLALVDEQDRVLDFELTIRTRESRSLQVLVAAERVEIEGEMCLVNIIRDVTGQRMMETEAREQRQVLTHLTRVATLGELSGALAHELNQPLTAILANAQAAQHFLARDPIDLPELRAILADIVEADKRAGEVIRRLRAMLRRSEMQLAPLDLKDVLEELFEFARGDLVTRNVTVITHFDPDLPRINGDRVQLQQLFLNLVTNACEAMSVREHADRTLTVSTRHGGDGLVHVSIADRGLGIPPERMTRLFEPFFTTKEQGLGLGLSICRTIVVAHGGRLWAENAGDGATFHAAFPIDGSTHT